MIYHSVLLSVTKPDRRKNTDTSSVAIATSNNNRLETKGGKFAPMRSSLTSWRRGLLHVHLGRTHQSQVTFITKNQSVLLMTFNRLKIL